VSPTKERAFLQVVLRRTSDGPKGFFSLQWAGLLVWLGLVFSCVLAFSIDPLLSRGVSGAMFVAIGALIAHLWLRVAAARGWPILGRYLDRNAIEARLRELGA
jgi:hypothetical protein